MAGCQQNGGLACKPQQKDCSEAAKSWDCPWVRTTRMESTTVMLKDSLKDTSMSAAMACTVVATLENASQTATPDQELRNISYRLYLTLLHTW